MHILFGRDFLGFAAMRDCPRWLAFFWDDAIRCVPRPRRRQDVGYRGAIRCRSGDQRGSSPATSPKSAPAQTSRGAPGAGQVWVNTTSKVYHGSRQYLRPWAAGCHPGQRINVLIALLRPVHASNLLTSATVPESRLHFLALAMTSVPLHIAAAKIVVKQSGETQNVPVCAHRNIDHYRAGAGHCARSVQYQSADGRLSN